MNNCENSLLSWQQVWLQIGGKRNSKVPEGEGVKEKKNSGDLGSGTRLYLLLISSLGASLWTSSAGILVALVGETCWVSICYRVHTGLTFCHYLRQAVVPISVKIQTEVPSAEILREVTAGGREDRSESIWSWELILRDQVIWLGSQYGEGIYVPQAPAHKAPKITKHVGRLAGEKKFEKKIYY